jgi:hypothetical protein
MGVAGPEDSMYLIMPPFLEDVPDIGLAVDGIEDEIAAVVWGAEEAEVTAGLVTAAVLEAGLAVAEGVGVVPVPQAVMRKAHTSSRVNGMSTFFKFISPFYFLFKISQTRFGYPDAFPYQR